MTAAPSTLATPTSTVVNCAGCGNQGYIPGSANWCRCCSTQPLCLQMGRANIYLQDLCIGNGFCSSSCNFEEYCFAITGSLPASTLSRLQTGTQTSIEPTSSEVVLTTLSAPKFSQVTQQEQTQKSVALSTPMVTQVNHGARGVRRRHRSCSHRRYNRWNSRDCPCCIHIRAHFDAPSTSRARRRSDLATSEHEK